MANEHPFCLRDDNMHGVLFELPLVNDHNYD